MIVRIGCTVVVSRLISLGSPYERTIQSVEQLPVTCVCPPFHSDLTHNTSCICITVHGLTHSLSFALQSQRSVAEQLMQLHNCVLVAESAPADSPMARRLAPFLIVRQRHACGELPLAAMQLGFLETLPSAWL